MLAPACEAKSTDEQSDALTLPVTEAVNPGATEDLDSVEEIVDHKDNRTKNQDLKNSLDEVDTEGEDADSISPCATVVPSNTPVTGDSGHVSPTMESSLDSLSDGTQQDLDETCIIKDTVETVAAKVTAKFTNSASIPIKEGNSSSPSSKKTKAVKENKKEEKKKSRRKEDNSSEHILRALNSLQSPDEKLAALCKKFADLHEEHRVLQTTFKAQQQTLTVVVKDKEQLRSEHTKAMMARSKLESLGRELQKQNKIIENESFKRVKESEDKRKDMSTNFSTMIAVIQTKMTDISEKNNILRKENENLTEQLRSFISQCKVRDEYVKNLQKEHDLENKLADAQLRQAEGIIKDVEDRSKKEKELMLLKLTEMAQKSQLTEAQLELYKSRYDEFNHMHARSSETFRKYKSEMEKMTKTIKRLENDELKWKTKCENSNKILLEQCEAKSKSEREAAVYSEKVKKLESLCRALHLELHRKTIVSYNKQEGTAQQTIPAKEDIPSSTAPPNHYPEVLSGESNPDPEPSSSIKATISTDSPSTTSSSELSACSTPASPNEPEAAAVTTFTECANQSCSVRVLPCAPKVNGTDIGFSCHEEAQTSSDTTIPLSLLTTAAAFSEDKARQQEDAVTPLEVTAFDKARQQEDAVTPLEVTACDKARQQEDAVTPLEVTACDKARQQEDAVTPLEVTACDKARQQEDVVTPLEVTACDKARQQEDAVTSLEVTACDDCVPKQLVSS